MKFSHGDLDNAVELFRNELYKYNLTTNSKIRGDLRSENSKNKGGEN